MSVSAELLATILILVGLSLNILGALAFVAFQWRPLRKLGMRIKREYERLDEGLVTLRRHRELTPEDTGFDEVSGIILGDIEHISGIEMDKLDPVVIEVSEDDETKLHLEDQRDYQMNIEPYVRVDFDLLKELADTHARNGFIKFGAVLLITGFALQFVGHASRIAL